MQRAWASVECLERGAIASNKIVCSFFVHYQRNEVVDVVTICASWVDVNFNNQLEAVHEWDGIIQDFLRGDKILTSSNQHHQVPFLCVLNHSCEIADGFDIILHLYGPGAPPKVSRRLISASSSSGSCITVLTAVFLCRWRQRYANLKSSFIARIHQSGYFLCAVTA